MDGGPAIGISGIEIDFAFFVEVFDDSEVACDGMCVCWQRGVCRGVLRKCVPRVVERVC